LHVRGHADAVGLTSAGTLEVRRLDVGTVDDNTQAASVAHRRVG